MTKKLVQNGFIAAGLINILGILTFSKLFSNDVIPETDPIVMSNFGLVMIMVWGIAFIAVSKNYEKVKWVVCTFAIEKLCYVIAWLIWFGKNDLSSVYQKDVLAGIFYSVYGVNDLLFMIFFIIVFFKINKSKIGYK